MVDTIKAYLNGEKAISCGESSVATLLSSLQRYENFREVKGNSGTYFEGNLKNLRVWYSPERGLTLEGSLPKYLNDENVSTLSRYDTERAIKELEGECGFPLHEATISRLDLGVCVPVEQAPEMYYKTLLSCANHTRERKQDGIIFRSGSNPIILYDKGTEVRQSGGVLPKCWQGVQYVVRLEVQYKKRVSQQLRVQGLTLGSLYSEPVWLRCGDNLQKRWENIRKLDPTTPICVPKTAKQVKDFAFAQHVHSIGLEAYIEELGTLGLPQKEYRRAEDYVVKAIEAYGKDTLQARPLIEELDSKISTEISRVSRT